MNLSIAAKDVSVGFHPDGYRIDKTALPINRYTEWEIQQGKIFESTRLRRLFFL